MGKQVAEKSSGMVHVYSRLANPQKFVKYLMPDPTDASQMGRLPVAERDVLIKGGAGIASKNLITPDGVHTLVTLEEYETVLVPDALFQQFVENGYIKVEKRAVDIDKIVADMNPGDPGAPLTPADFAAEPVDGTKPLPTELDKTGTGWVAAQVANR